MVSSGRSDFASASPTKLDTPGSAAAATGSIGAAAPPSPVAANEAVRTVAMIFGSVELDRLDRIAGVDRPLEALRAEHLGDVGKLHHVEQRRRARQHVLGERAGGGEDRVIFAGQRDEQRRQRLGEAMGVGRIVGDPHLGDAVELGRGFRRRADILAGDQHMHRRAELLGGGERARADVGEMAAGDFAKKKRRHAQITPASSRSFETSSATVLTLTPALRPPGSVVFSTLTRGLTSTP